MVKLDRELRSYIKNSFIHNLQDMRTETILQNSLLILKVLHAKANNFYEMSITQ
jgi:hypothetical protein